MAANLLARLLPRGGSGGWPEEGFQKSGHIFIVGARRITSRTTWVCPAPGLGASTSAAGAKVWLERLRCPGWRRAREEGGWNGEAGSYPGITMPTRRRQSIRAGRGRRGKGDLISRPRTNKQTDRRQQNSRSGEVDSSKQPLREHCMNSRIKLSPRYLPLPDQPSAQSIESHLTSQSPPSDTHHRLSRLTFDCPTEKVPPGHHQPQAYVLPRMPSRGGCSHLSVVLLISAPPGTHRLSRAVEAPAKQFQLRPVV